MEDTSHHNIIEVLEEGTVTQVGLVFGATVPAVGVVFGAEGNAIYEAGPHDVLNTEGHHAARANFCPALI